MKFIFILFYFVCFNYGLKNDGIINAMVEIFRKHYMDEEKSTAVIYGMFPNDLYDKLSAFEVDFIILGYEESNRRSIRKFIKISTGIILIRIDNFYNLSKAFCHMKKIIHWSSKVKIMAYSSNNIIHPETFYLFYWFKIQYGILLTSNDNDVLITEYDPYIVSNGENQYSCWSSVKVETIGNETMAPHIRCQKSCFNTTDSSDSMILQACLELKTWQYKNDSTFFNDKTGDLKGYTLSLIANEVHPFAIIDRNKTGLKMLKGRDGCIMQMIAQKMNFTVKPIFNVDFGDPDLVQWLQNIQDISLGYYDLSLTPMYLTYFDLHVDYTYPVDETGLCFVMHRSGYITTFKRLINIFDVKSIIVFMFVFHLTFLLYFYFIYKHSREGFWGSMANGYFCTIQFFLLSPVKWNDRNKTLRTFTFIIFWFAFIVSIAVQGIVVTLYAIPKTYPEVNTFKELYDTGYKIEGFPNIHSFLPDDSDINIALNKRFVPIYKLFTCIKDLKKYPKKGCWLDCQLAYISKSNMKDDNGNFYLHVGHDRVVNTYYSYYMKTNSPLFERYNRYIMRIIESGFIVMWKRSLALPKSDASSEAKPRSMNDFKICFYLLFFGYILATIAFMMEVLLKRCGFKDRLRFGY